MKIDHLIKYSDDYKDFKYHPSAIFYFSLLVDFDFALSLPDMESKTYYRKDTAKNIRERINSLGVFLRIYYKIATREITFISVIYGPFCQVSYDHAADIDKIIQLYLQGRKKMNKT